MSDFKAKMHHIWFGWGSAPDPAGGNISETINPIESKYEDRPETLICISWVVCSNLEKIQYG